MKGRSIYIACLISLLVVGNRSLSAQQLDDSYVLNAPRFREKFYMDTDRDLYAAGEPVYFRIFNLSHTLLKENNWSKVFYLEVINERNVPVAQGKYQVDRGDGEGKLMLPDTISSGNYYLRGYTRWMRNYPASGYSYVPLAVVNPQQLNLGELEYVNDTANGSTESGVDYSGIESFTALEEGILCDSYRKHYAKRDSVKVRIGTDKSVDLYNSVTVSVVKLEYSDTTGSCYSGLDSGIPYRPETVRFTPETRGITLEGIIVGGEDEQPAPHATLHLTLLGEERDYLGIVADRNGRIHLSIPSHEQASNALVTFDANGGTTYKLILEDAFSNEYLQTAVPRTDYFANRVKVLEEMMVYVQLREVFGINVTVPDTAADTSSGSHFYGTPEYRYRPVDYIPIPNLEEFLFELVPYVVIRKRKQEYEVVMMDDEGYYLDYSPLILLDHVAVQDLDALFKTDPRLIEYIDVINTHYIRGGNYYGGILSIISKEGNLAGVGLPDGSTIIELQTFQDTEENLPQNVSPPSREEHIPDLRTLLYWNPGLQIYPDSQTVIEFLTSDIEGTYVVTVTGMTTTGEIITDRCLFQVD